MGGGAGKHWAFVAERVVEGFLLAQLSYWYDQYHGYGRLNPLGTETQPKPLVYLQVALFPNAWVQQRKTRVQFCKPHPRILVTNYLELVWTKKLAVLNGLRPKKIGLLCAHMKKKKRKKKGADGKKRRACHPMRIASRTFHADNRSHAREKHRAILALLAIFVAVVNCVRWWKAGKNRAFLVSRKKTFFSEIFGRTARISGFTFPIGSPGSPSQKVPPIFSEAV